jgi:RNA polymerase sigma-70 factor (ECF subfamily)
MEPRTWSGEDMNMTLDDESVLRVSLSEPERFGELFDRHHRTIWVYVSRLAGTDVADDIVGDVFVVAFANRRTFDGSRGTVRAWLYGIATNRLRTRLRSEFRARRAFAKVARSQIAAEDGTTVVDDADELAASMDAVLRAMSRLRRSERELIVLHAWEELSYAEMAIALDVPIGTVRSRLSRARQRLRELIESPGKEPVDPLLREVTS